MGFGVNGKCYSTQALANEAFCSQFPIVQASTSSTTFYTHMCTAFSGTSVTLRVTSNATNGTAYTVAPVYANCNPDNLLADAPFQLTVAQGSLIGGAIAAVWALAWACKQILRAINTDPPEN